MPPEFVVPPFHRIHIAWDDALLKKTGREGQDLEYSLPLDVDRIFEELEASKKKKIALYVHGGLVSGEAEFGQPPFHMKHENQILFDALKEESYPIYFIWESGVKESLRSAAKDWGEELIDNPILFLRRHMASLIETYLFKIIMKYLPGVLADKAKAVAGLGLAERPEVEDAWIEENVDKLSQYEPAIADYEKFDRQDEEKFLEKLSADPEFMHYLKQLGGKGGMGLAPHPDIATLSTNASGFMQRLNEDFEDVPTEPAQVSLVERPGEGLAEVAVLAQAARFFRRLLRAVGKRFLKKEDHGFVATIVEEFFRLSDLNRLGILIWKQMKENAREAYVSEDVNGVPHAGHYFIVKLAEYLRNHPDTQVILIGHSAGAIHLSYFLEAVDAYFKEKGEGALENFQFSQVIFLAPAVNFETFQKVLNQRKRIKQFHIFTMEEADEMCDALLSGVSKNEAIDRFLSIVYPCSLLYAVSGIAEDRKKGDVPLLGLARHLDERVYRGSDQLVRDTHRQLREWPASIVWSHNNTREELSEAIFSERASGGQFCLALKHGDFDNDSWTALSIAAILKR